MRSLSEATHDFLETFVIGGLEVDGGRIMELNPINQIGEGFFWGS